MGTSVVNKENFNGSRRGQWKQKELFVLVTYAFVFYVVIIRRSLQLSHGISLIPDYFLFSIILFLQLYFLLAILVSIVCFGLDFHRLLQTTIWSTSRMAHSSSLQCMCSFYYSDHLVPKYFSSWLGCLSIFFWMIKYMLVFCFV